MGTMHWWKYSIVFYFKVSFTNFNNFNLLIRYRLGKGRFWRVFRRNKVVPVIKGEGKRDTNETQTNDVVTLNSNTSSCKKQRVQNTSTDDSPSCSCNVTTVSSASSDVTGDQLMTSPDESSRMSFVSRYTKCSSLHVSFINIEIATIEQVKFTQQGKTISRVHII